MFFLFRCGQACIVMPKFTQSFTRGLTLFDWSIGHTRLPLLPKWCPLCLKLIDPCPFRNFFCRSPKVSCRERCSTRHVFKNYVLVVFIKIIEKYILPSKVAGFLRKMNSKCPLLFGKVLLHTLRVFFFLLLFKYFLKFELQDSFIRYISERNWWIILILHIQVDI